MIEETEIENSQCNEVRFEFKSPQPQNIILTTKLHKKKNWYSMKRTRVYETF